MNEPHLNRARDRDIRFGAYRDARGSREQTRGFAEIALRNLPAWIARDIVLNKLTVLNWGCAEGDATEALGRALGTSVTGVDTAERPVALARRRFPDRRFACSSIDEIETHDVLFTSRPLKPFENPLDVLGRLLARTRKYALVLIPWREGRSRDDSLATFEVKSLPYRIGEFFLVSFATAETAGGEDSVSAVGQILAVYANLQTAPLEQQRQVATAFALLDGERDAAEWETHAGTLEKRKAEVEEVQGKLLQKQRALITSYQGEIANLNAQLYRWQQRSDDWDVRLRALETVRADLVDARAALQAQQSTVAGYQAEIATLNAQISRWRQQEDEWQSRSQAVAQLQVKATEVVGALKEAADRLRLLAKTKPYRVAHFLRRLNRDLLKGSTADRRDALRWLRKRLRGKQTPSGQAKNPLLDAGIALVYMSAQLQEAEIMAFAAAVQRGPQSCHDVLCFSAIEWASGQRPQLLMAEFAAAGHRVFYISQHFHLEGPAYRVVQIAANVYQVSLRLGHPTAPHDGLDARACDELFEAFDVLRREQGVGAAISCVALPFWQPLVECLRTRFTWPVIYDCAELGGSSTRSWAETVDERERVRAEADLLIVSSHSSEPGVPSVEQRLTFARTHTWHERFAALEPVVRNSFPSASMIIVTYNNLPFSRLCLQSLYSHTDWPNFEVIVVDNASTDGTREYLREAEQQFPHLRVVLNEANLGFAAANNIGLQIARGEYLVLLNNDTVVVRGWLSTLIRHLAADASIGLIGPATNETCNEAQVPVGYRQLKEMPAWAAEFARQYDGHTFDIPMLAMFCVAMRRTTFAEIGSLDERFGIGMFEDDDYSLRMRNGGYRVVCAVDAFVYHFGCASFQKLKESGMYQRVFTENRRRYEAKWNVVWTPHQRGVLRPGVDRPELR